MSALIDVPRLGIKTVPLLQKLGIQTAEELAALDIQPKHRRAVPQIAMLKQNAISILNLPSLPNVNDSLTEIPIPPRNPDNDSRSDSTVPGYAFQDHAWTGLEVIIPRELVDNRIVLQKAEVQELIVSAEHPPTFILRWACTDQVCERNYSPYILMWYNMDALPEFALVVQKGTWNSLPAGVQYSLKNMVWEIRCMERDLSEDHARIPPLHTKYKS